MSSFELMHIRGRPAPKKKVCNFVGGVISPLLANIALHGMEAEVKAAMGKDLNEWYKGITSIIGGDEITCLAGLPGAAKAGIIAFDLCNFSVLEPRATCLKTLT